VISWSSEAQYKEGFGPLTPGFKVVPFGDAAAVEKAITPNTCAIIVEPIQGEGGVIVPPQGYLTKLRELCTRHNVLMVADEVQTGLGRTGKLFACNWENVKPDAMILGKALAGGMYPVSVFLATEAVMGVFKPGDHGSTFGGNPLGAAIGRAALNVLVEEKLADRANDLGEWFMGELRQIDSPHIKDVRGKGLLIGVEMKRESGTARPYCEALAERGILCKETHDQVVRFAPPLVVEKKDLEWALTHIAEVLAMSFAKRLAMAGAR
jgi:ornithine--oxo-acid transaminase